MNGNIGICVEKEFQTIDFRSKRLEKRFLQVMSDLAEEPEKSIWLASGSPTNAKAAYRMLGNQDFTKENILSAHRNATNNCSRQNNALLSIQDAIS
ncbi:MAG: hypothetical protein LBI79_04815 [Nitrososphaerota archaeon]|nr:hypothetical protein [Nitrososphaerota archaeon]